MESYFRREWVLSTIDIGGHYKFGDIFQIYALNDSHPKPPIQNLGHFPLIIEYFVEIDEDNKKKLIEEMCINASFNRKERIFNSSYSEGKRDEIMILLTLFSPSLFFVYSRRTQELSWFVPLGNDCHEMFWGEKYYSPNIDNIETREEFSQPSTKEIPRIEASKYYDRLFTYPGQNKADEEFSLPNNIDKLFEKYFGLADEAQLAFLRSSTFFYQCMIIWFESHSLAYAALISSLESLIQYEYKDVKFDRCDKCNTDQYKVMKKFRDFFNIDHLPPEDKIRIYVNKLYDLRSQILHQGYILKSDLSTHRYCSSDEREQMSMLMNLVSITRKRLLDWLLNQ